MSVIFRNSQNFNKVFTYTELDQILTDLNSYNQYYQSGSDDIAFIRISFNHLLIIDLNFMFNRMLFENYSFQYSIENIFNLKLINNNLATETSLDEALISIGYSGNVPISSLSKIFMLLYSKTVNNNNGKKQTINLFDENIININKNIQTIKKSNINLFDEYSINVRKYNNTNKKSIINIFDENLIDIKKICNKQKINNKFI